MLRLLLSIGLLSSLLACESALSPGVSTGVYALRSADPVVLQNSSVRIEVLADTIWLESGGSARRVVREHLDYVSFRDTTVTRTEPYRYETDGASIEMEYVCPPNALCAPPPHIWGHVTDEGLELRFLVDPRPLVRYRRIR